MWIFTPESIVFDGTRDQSFSLEVLTEASSPHERRLWNHPDSRLSPDQELALVKALWQEAASTKRRLHIPDVSCHLVREFLAHEYQKLGYFDARTRSYNTPPKEAPLTAGVRLFDLMFSRQDAARVSSEPSTLRDASDTKSLRAGVNEGLFVTIDPSSLSQGHLQEALFKEFIPLKKAAFLLCESWKSLGYEVATERVTLTQGE